MGKAITGLLVAVALAAFPAVTVAQFTEQFETGLPTPAVPHGPPGATLTLASGSWFAINKSSPIGTTGVFQQGGAGAPFPANPGDGTFYAAMNFNSASGAGTSDVWLQSPVIPTLQNGDVIKFITRSIASPFPDRLFVRLSTSGASTDTGPNVNNVGVFVNQLLVINPGVVVGGYPNTWTEFTITLSGIVGTPSGRFAFNYNVPNSGPSGVNGDFIGIDRVQYIPIPEPTAAMVVLGAMGLMTLRRRHSA